MTTAELLAAISTLASDTANQHKGADDVASTGLLAALAVVAEAVRALPVDVSYTCYTCDGPLDTVHHEQCAKCADQSSRCQHCGLVGGH